MLDLDSGTITVENGHIQYIYIIQMSYLQCARAVQIERTALPLIMPGIRFSE